MGTVLFPELLGSSDRAAVRVRGETWSYGRLAEAAQAHAAGLSRRGVAPGTLVRVTATPSLTTAAEIVGNALFGAVTVPINPKLGPRELDHIVSETDGVRLSGASSDEAPMFVLYTSGTTGAPKGAVLTVKNVASNLDALARVWQWTANDTVVHALPWFHVHGLILGLLGSLRVGGSLHYVASSDAGSLARAVGEHASSVLFAVPTLFHRLANACEDDADVAHQLGQARLLISGSAGLPVREHRRIQALCDRGVHERYGTTETMIACAVPAWAPPQPGYVGPPLSGTELKLVDDEGVAIESSDDRQIGEVAIRSDSVFAGYLGRPDATTAVLDRDGWFLTGDLATRRLDGSIRIVGRRSTDLIKTGGYRVGAGEVEACLLEHPAVAEVAVVGVPDDELGQRLVAYVVVRAGASRPEEKELSQYVATELTPHKRPRDVHFVATLPRNAMGKVQKKQLLHS